MKGFKIKMKNFSKNNLKSKRQTKDGYAPEIRREFSEQIEKLQKKIEEQKSRETEKRKQENFSNRDYVNGQNCNFYSTKVFLRSNKR